MGPKLCPAVTATQALTLCRPWVWSRFPSRASLQISTLRECGERPRQAVTVPTGSICGSQGVLYRGRGPRKSKEEIGKVERVSGQGFCLTRSSDAKWGVVEASRLVSKRS